METKTDYEASRAVLDLIFGPPQEAPDKAPPSEAECVLGRAAEDVLCRRYAEAIKGLRLYTGQPWPRQLKARLLLGEAYFGAGRFGEAVEALEEARKMNRRNPTALRLLGLAKFRQGKRPEANEILAEAVRRNPRNADCLWAAAKARVLQGDWRMAACYYNQAFDNGRRPYFTLIDAQMLNVALISVVAEAIVKLRALTKAQLAAALAELTAIVASDLFARNERQRYPVASLGETLGCEQAFACQYVARAWTSRISFPLLQEYWFARMQLAEAKR